MIPTCVNLRNEFRLLYNAGCDNGDKRVIREFLQLPFDKDLTDITVKKCDADKFKPLCNFITKNLKTHERNFELLAWIVNFPQRPYSKYWRITNGKPDLLSELSINNQGIFEESLEETIQYRDQASLVKTNKMNFGNGKPDIWKKTEQIVVDGIRSDNNVGLPEREVTLEYPSGVKLSVAATDISLIKKLIKLW